MKLFKWLGIIAAIVLVISCFLPWTYHPDIQKTFTGFFSENAVYGRPGILIVTLASISILLILIPKVWAKRINIFIVGILLAFAIRCFMIFTGCYVGICPEKKAGIWIMLFSTIILLGTSLFPDLKLKPGSGSAKK